MPRTSGVRKVADFIVNLPRFEFTSGQVTDFIDGRVTYQSGWDNIKKEGFVTRVGVPRGKRTTWRKTRSLTKLT